MKEPGRFAIDTLMGIKRAKAHHTCHKACMEWLQNKQLLTSVEYLRSLQQALTLEQDVYPFSVSREGKKLTVIFHHSHKPALLLCSEDDKLTILFILQYSLSKSNLTESVRNMAISEESI